MAISISSRALIVSLALVLLLISFLVLTPVQADASVEKNTEQGSPYKKLDISECGGACSARCRLSSRPHLCKRACGTCCKRCSCVPPGTAGNQEVCPCYAALTTHGGRRKCP